MSAHDENQAPQGAVRPASGGGGGGGAAGGMRAGSDVVPSLPIQDLCADKLLLNAPRMTWNNHTVPAPGGIPLLARLGQGGMGAVYYGIHPRLKQEVAVKILPVGLPNRKQDTVKRFYREARLAAKVKSPHLVAVTDVNEDNGLCFLVMEFVRGISGGDFLQQALDEGRGGLEEATALDLCIAATRGLCAAHEAGVVHRDVKPDNILVPHSKTDEILFHNAKLADLGLARGEDAGQSLTADGAAVGTPAYMAPEQAQDAHRVGKSADVYSMGATLYALLCGRPPFVGRTAMTIMLAVIKDPCTPIKQFRPDLSAATATLIENCLSKDPSARYVDAFALLDGLKLCRVTLAQPAVTLNAIEQLTLLKQAAEVGERVPDSDAGAASPDSNAGAAVGTEVPIPSGGNAPAGGAGVPAAGGEARPGAKHERPISTVPPPMPPLSRKPAHGSSAVLDDSAFALDPKRAPTLAPSDSDPQPPPLPNMDSAQPPPLPRLHPPPLPRADAPTLPRFDPAEPPTLPPQYASAAYPVPLYAPQASHAPQAPAELPPFPLAAWHALGPNGELGPPLVFPPPFAVDAAHPRPPAPQSPASPAWWGALFAVLLMLGGGAYSLWRMAENARHTSVPDPEKSAAQAAVERAEAARAAFRKEYESARQAAAQGDFAAAEARLALALAALRLVAPASLPVEETLALLPEEKEAEALLSSARAELKRRADFNSRLALAREQAGRRQFDAARRTWREAEAIWPDSPRQVEVREGITAADKALADARREESVRAGNAAIAAGKWDEARAAFGRALADSPGDPAALQGLKAADEGATDERYRAAMEEGGKALRERRAGAAEAAEAAFRRAQALRPGDRAAAQGLQESAALKCEECYAAAMREGQAALAQREWIAAREAFNRALAEKPGDAEALKGIAATRSGTSAERYETAMRQAASALAGELWSEAESAYLRALIEKDNDAPAREGLEKAQQGQREARCKKLLASAADALDARRWSDAVRDLKEAGGLRARSKEVESGLARAAEGLNREGQQLYKNSDYAAAAPLLQQAAELGNPDAQARLGILKAKGLGVAKDEKEAAKWLAAAARRNLPEAQYVLGWMYADGAGVPQDWSECVAWVTRAAEQNYPEALGLLGNLNYLGRGVPENLPAAAQWYRKAAELGHAHSQRMLGEMLQQGRGIARDLNEAVRWYKQAADKGDLLAVNNLGRLYLNEAETPGVTSNFPEALRLFQSAADRGDTNGEVNLGRMYMLGRGVAQDYGRALALFKKAAAKQSPRGLYHLGYMHEQGFGAAQNPAEALNYYRQAAGKGSSDAQFTLGTYYSSGRPPVKADPAAALEWFKKAAQQGHRGAQAELRKAGVALDGGR